NMDLYKWSFKAMPWIGSDLLWDCFQFATRCREIDRRASPYDLRSLGYAPIPIETEAGRREYEREQLALMNAGRPLRERLIAALENVLAAPPSSIS
ncbi:MAG: 3-methyladenine DNA glycosylase, partial [Verrucomicrobia bacterium]|nr:3-methyladenine DNA glycosylase [Verrucomicrobiota bacterium]